MYAAVPSAVPTARKTGVPPPAVIIEGATVCPALPVKVIPIIEPVLSTPEAKLSIRITRPKLSAIPSKTTTQTRTGMLGKRTAKNNEAAVSAP